MLDVTLLEIGGLMCETKLRHGFIYARGIDLDPLDCHDDDADDDKLEHFDFFWSISWRFVIQI